jgi:hypothetical protein
VQNSRHRFQFPHQPQACLVADDLTGNADPVLAGDTCRDVHTVIGRAVVHDGDVEVAERLGEDAPQAGLEKARTSINGESD